MQKLTTELKTKLRMAMGAACDVDADQVSLDHAVNMETNTDLVVICAQPGDGREASLLIPHDELLANGEDDDWLIAQFGDVTMPEPEPQPEEPSDGQQSDDTGGSTGDEPNDADGERSAQEAGDADTGTDTQTNGETQGE